MHRKNSVREREREEGCNRTENKLVICLGDVGWVEGNDYSKPGDWEKKSACLSCGLTKRFVNNDHDEAGYQ